jgi:aldose 1-epimerase
MHLDSTMYVLSNSATGTSAEVWPALGFNCFRWQAAKQGQVLNLLYSDPQLFHGAKPTRSGIPILFPFPNRLRDGKFSWQGKDYQLPINDPTQRNAIHGFACFRPWRVVDKGADTKSAWLTGEFSSARDADETRALWPADYQLRITYRLNDHGLRIEAQVSNPDSKPLPFGLGYHPYFKIPFQSGHIEQDYSVSSSAQEYWELDENLPTGKRRPVDDSRNLTTGRSCAGLNLDDLFVAGQGQPSPAPEALCWRAGLRQTSDRIGIDLLTTAAFRELVVFTPPHRQAMCLEPYTCTTDAINLQQRGIDAGLIVLEPGGEWREIVELRAA